MVFAERHLPRSDVAWRNAGGYGFGVQDRFQIWTSGNFS